MAEPVITSVLDILTNPPKGVDLTLVGGQALIYWTLFHIESYPELFPDDVISSTYDIDFIVSMKKACEQCHEHWGGELLIPDAEDMTPELGMLIFNKGTDDRLEVDLLQDLFKMSRPDIHKHRLLIKPDDPDFEMVFVLSEWAVLLNRVNNTVGLSKYQRPEALIQVRNAFSVYHAHILSLLDEGDVGGAQSGCHKLIQLAKNSRLGMPLFLKHGLDVLDAIPVADDRFEAVFKEKALAPGILQVREKQARLQHSRDQKLTEMSEKQSS